MNPSSNRLLQVSAVFRIPFILGAVLAVLDILIFILNWPSGLLILAFLVGYFAMLVYLYMENRSIMTKEMVRFAAEYEHVENRVLQQMVHAYAILDGSMRVLWRNGAFDTLVGEAVLRKKNLTQAFPQLRREALPHDDNLIRIPVTWEDKNLTAHIRRVSLAGLASGSVLLGEEGMQESVYLLCLTDDTAVRIAVQEVDDQSMVAGFVYIDNYEEAVEPLEEVKRSLLVALIDRQVSKYILSFDGICSKIEKDKYLILLRKKALRQLQEGHFDLLGDVKTVNIGNEMAITLSIGVGLDGLSYAQNYEFARNAIDLALGRGGDQAVVKMPDNIIYYGGKTQQIEKSTRVKARVKAQAMKEILYSRDKVFIMGHRLGDIDCVGAGIGIYRIARTLNKEAHIVLNDVSASLQPIVDTFRNNPAYPEDMFYTSQTAIEKVTDNSALVVVDVNRPSITECPELLRLCRSIIVLDHHRQGSEVIENATLSYVEAYASSACEMVSEILQYIGENIKIRQEEADAMYAGIVIDTDNFQNKTGVRTFEAAAFLRRNGTDVARVRKLFRENADEYKARADAVSQAEIYRGTYAISVCPGEGLPSPTVVGAQAANELLNIKGVRGSFVLTEYQNQIFVSARSIDEVNVQIIMEKLGGGGHMNIAGCQLRDVTLAEAIGILKHTIDTMIEDGEL